jgi:hypothetical protein
MSLTIAGLERRFRSGRPPRHAYEDGTSTGGFFVCYRTDYGLGDRLTVPDFKT